MTPEQMAALEAARRYAQSCESRAMAPRMSNANSVALQRMDAAWMALQKLVTENIK